MLTIYLVDDDIWILNELENIIDYSQFGYKIIGKSNFGATALEEIKSLKPNLVITDIQMDDVNGLELIKQLKETNNDMYYIFLSGYDKFDYAVEAIKLGAFRYLKKPIRKDELINCLLEIKEKIIRNFVDKLKHYVENNSYKSVKLLESNNFLKDFPYSVVAINGKEFKDNDFDLNFGTYFLNVYSDEVIHIFMVFNFDLSKLKTFANNHKELSICYSEIVNAGEYDKINDLIRKVRINSKNKFVYGYNSLIKYEQKSIDEYLKSIDSINQISILENFILNIKSYIIKNNILVSDIQKIYNHVLFSMFKLGVADYDDGLVNLSVVDTYENIDECANDLISYFHSEKTTDEKDLIIDEVIKEIETHLTDKISLSYMADKYKYNVSYFSQLFKKTVGVSFVEYVINLKIDRAKYMIINTNEQLQSIAFNLGYDDYYHFSKIFKKYTSYSPSEYRNLFKK